MNKIPRPCLDCGALTTNGNRCEKDQMARGREKQRREAGSLERQAKKKLLYKNPEYRRRSELIRKTATVCWLCGRGALPGDPWTADHVNAGDPNSELRPAHRSCNSKRGNKK